MIADSIRDGFDQCGSLLGYDDLSGLLAGVVYGEDVVAVDCNGRHPVRDTSHGDAIARILIVNGGRDRVHVVAAEEQGLGAQGRCKVQG